MNNKYSIACITLVRDKYTVRLYGAPCSSSDGVTACVVYTADSIRKFDSKSNRTADSIRDSIRTQKNDSQVPMFETDHWPDCVLLGGPSNCRVITSRHTYQIPIHGIHRIVADADQQRYIDSRWSSTSVLTTYRELSGPTIQLMR